MSKHGLASIAFFNAPSSPLVINFGGTFVGLAIKDRHSFRFFAGHPDFNLLDGSRFRRVQDIHLAVRRLSQANIRPPSRVPSPSKFRKQQTAF